MGNHSQGNGIEEKEINNNNCLLEILLFCE
jgi:hypothetical protein